MTQPNSIDIYCQVIDNFGDAGVCWRLARSLASRGFDVTLWIDELSRLAALRTQLQPQRLRQSLDGFTVCAWDQKTPAHVPADIVIEAFGCRMPTAQLHAMAQKRPVPVWINLEYLSAEDWVGECHGLPSPHPSLPLTRYFFFPGFDDRSGGLIRETDLLSRRALFDEQARTAFLQRIGITLRPGELLLSVFCYPTAPLTQWQAALRNGPPVMCVLPIAGGDSRQDGMHGHEYQTSEGALRTRVLPFLDPDDYDRLLWSCDVNFVRGEDSAVRAQWAGRPFVWQLYPQAEGAHHAKREAFLHHYLQGIEGDLATLVSHSWRWWNGEIVDPPDAGALLHALPCWSAHAQRWASTLGEQPDLSSRLLGFVDKIR
jgi:uncharacterized repeat protein (TIGR03837 family)